MLSVNEFHHPVTADIILMAATYTKDSSLICDNSPTELRYIEIILKVDLIRDHLIDIEEVNVL